MLWGFWVKPSGLPPQDPYTPLLFVLIVGLPSISLLTVGEFVAWPRSPSHILCLAQPTCSRLLTNSISFQKVHMKSLGLFWWPDLGQLFFK